MDNLPAELLSSIHLTLLPIPPCHCSKYDEYPYPTRIKALTRLRLVSRQWNDIVLDTPQLWSYINIGSGDLWWDTTRLSLERTRGAPLHIRIHFGYLRPDGHEDLIQMLKRVWSEAHRWETYACEGTAFFPWCLLPPRPLPQLREVYISATQETSPVKIQAPRLEALWEPMTLTDIETSGAPALRSWAVPNPSNREEWERFIKVVQNCRQLEWLSLRPHHGGDRAFKTLEDWRLPEASGGIYFPSLKQFEFAILPLTVNFLSHLHAPNLQRLIVRYIRCRHLPGVFSIPTRLFESSPKLDAIRFGGRVPLELIQQCLVAVPHDRIAGMEVEVEVESKQWRLPQLEELTEHRKCLDSLCRIQWIRI